MRALVMAVGEEAIFAEAGLTADRGISRTQPEAKSPIGLISLEIRHASAFGVGLPFGRIEANALHALADISERYGDGNLRTTPWRALLLTGVAARRARERSDEVDRARSHHRSRRSAPQYLRLRRRAVLHERKRRCARRCRPPCRRRRRDARRHAACFWLQLNPAPIVAQRRSPSSAATGATISSATGSATDRPSLTGLTMDEVEALLLSTREQRR